MNAVYLEHDRKQQNLYESSIWNPIELKELEDAAEQEKLGSSHVSMEGSCCEKKMR